MRSVVSFFFLFSGILGCGGIHMLTMDSGGVVRSVQNESRPRRGLGRHSVLWGDVGGEYS